MAYNFNKLIKIISTRNPCEPLTSEAEKQIVNQLCQLPHFQIMMQNQSTKQHLAHYLLQFFNNSQVKVHQKGSYFLHYGDYCNHINIIIQGSAALYDPKTEQELEQEKCWNKNNKHVKIAIQGEINQEENDNNDTTISNSNNKVSFEYKNICQKQSNQQNFPCGEDLREQVTQQNIRTRNLVQKRSSLATVNILSDITKDDNDLMDVEQVYFHKYYQKNTCLFKKRQILKVGDIIGSFQNHSSGSKNNYTCKAIEDVIVLQITGVQYNNIFGKLFKTIAFLENVFNKILIESRPEIIRALCFCFKEKNLTPKELIYTEGEEVNNIYVIAQGNIVIKKKVSKYLRTDYVKEQVFEEIIDNQKIKLLSQGDIFGYEDIFTSKHHRFSAQNCNQNTILYVMDKKQLPLLLELKKMGIQFYNHLQDKIKLLQEKETLDIRQTLILQKTTINSKEDSSINKTNNQMINQPPQRPVSSIGYQATENTDRQQRTHSQLSKRPRQFQQLNKVKDLFEMNKETDKINQLNNNSSFNLLANDGNIVPNFQKNLLLSPSKDTPGSSSQQILLPQQRQYLKNYSQKMYFDSKKSQNPNHRNRSYHKINNNNSVCQESQQDSSFKANKLPIQHFIKCQFNTDRKLYPRPINIERYFANLQNQDKTRNLSSNNKNISYEDANANNNISKQSSEAQIPLSQDDKNKRNSFVDQQRQLQFIQKQKEKQEFIMNQCDDSYYNKQFVNSILNTLYKQKEFIKKKNEEPEPHKPHVNKVRFSIDQQHYSKPSVIDQSDWQNNNNYNLKQKLSINQQIQNLFVHNVPNKLKSNIPQNEQSDTKTGNHAKTNSLCINNKQI